jgi:hypothetical protein
MSSRAAKLPPALGLAGLLAAAATAGCGASAGGAVSGAAATAATPSKAPALASPASARAVSSAPSDGVAVPTAVAAPEPLAIEAPERSPSARLELGAPSIAVPVGRSFVDIAIEPGRFTSIAILGSASALLGFDIVAPPAMRAVVAHGALDEDGYLPKVTSFRAPAGVSTVTVLVDIAEPAELSRISADPGVVPPELFSPKPLVNMKRLPAFPLVGFPAPLSRDDGYLLQSPSRYQFIRIDVAMSLLAALRQTRVRFKRDPIAIADISQWNGERPATDQGRPRHISHEGGRDIDIALPADDGFPSTVRAHCEGVLVESDAQGCAPGTARGFDALRAAYFLGLLLDGGPPGRIERVFTDDAYVREIRRAAEVLRTRRWIKDAGFEQLFDDALVRPSPWHVDHIHIRFSGQPARAPW